MPEFTINNAPLAANVVALLVLFPYLCFEMALRAAFIPTTRGPTTPTPASFSYPAGHLLLMDSPPPPISSDPLFNP